MDKRQRARVRPITPEEQETTMYQQTQPQSGQYSTRQNPQFGQQSQVPQQVQSQPQSQMAQQPQSQIAQQPQSQMAQQPQSQAWQQPQTSQGIQSAQQPQALQQQSPLYAASQPTVSGAQAQAGGQQVATALQELERTLEQANVYALENGNPIVARVTKDLEAMTEAERKLIHRESPFAESLRPAIVESLQQGIQELQRQPDDPAIQELITQVQQSATALQNGSFQAPAVSTQAALQGQQAQQPQVTHQAPQPQD